MKKLPIGIQDFEKLRTNGFMYIDKTKEIFNLVDGAGYYFLSRPRRFGKSLLVSTLKEIFSGNKELFKDLWIEDKIEWKKYPVIHLDFSNANYKSLGLEKAIQERLDYQANLHEISLERKAISDKLEELVRKLHTKFNERVVILIDEYDKPIIDFLGKDEIHIAEENRNIMKTFYSPIKGLDAHLRFFFLTGVSRFSKVSIFSDLNNLIDLTLNPLAKTLLGYTQEELEYYFADYIKHVSSSKQTSEIELKNQIREWYNGYNFRGTEKVYNPFSIINFMADGEFNNYWFETATPSFLIKLTAEGGYYDIKNERSDLDSLANFEIRNLDPIAVLFQTGYITLKEHIIRNTYALGYPNAEVELSMIKLLLAEYSKRNTRQTVNTLILMKEHFDKNELDKVFVYLNSLFASIPNQIFEAKIESYYHSIIYLTFKLLGYYTQAEVSTSEGRIDALVQNDKYIYVLEFKIGNTAKSAIKQIKTKKYAEKYKTEKQNGKEVYIIGVACNEKTITDYLIEEV